MNLQEKLRVPQLRTSFASIAGRVDVARQALAHGGLSRGKSALEGGAKTLTKAASALQGLADRLAPPKNGEPGPTNGEPGPTKSS
jgi:hypothetical protein